MQVEHRVPRGMGNAPSHQSEKPYSPCADPTLAWRFGVRLRLEVSQLKSAPDVHDMDCSDPCRTGSRSTIPVTQMRTNTDNDCGPALLMCTSNWSETAHPCAGRRARGQMGETV